MNQPRPFTAESSKMAYAQAFTRSTTVQHVRPERHSPLRGLTARLHRPAKLSR